MGKESKKTKACARKKNTMLAYGLIQLSTRLISSIALASIALNFVNIEKDSDLFTYCLEQSLSNGQTAAEAVKYCKESN
tara:strand:- start:305 stop:541 length:237 start_codon:yes stop_codon:yes gene_type:complete